MTRLRAGGASLTGRVRTENQDNLVIAEAKQLFAVADGMGGHRGGEVASEVAAETLDAAFVEGSAEGLADGVQKANEAIVERASNDSALRGMGTTLCAMALVEVDGEERLAVANVGDSRLYLLKASSNQIVQVTEDHSLVETLFRQGQLTREEAEVHPHRNILTRALGIDAEVLVDLFELLALPGDRYLICSDGLFNEVDEHTMSDVLFAHDDPQAASDDLAHRADDNGGRDNITVIVVDVVGDDPEALVPDPSLDRIVKVDRPTEQLIDYPKPDPVTTPQPAVAAPPEEVSVADQVPPAVPPEGREPPPTADIPPPSAPPADVAAAPAPAPAGVVVSPRPADPASADAAAPASVVTGPTGQRSRFTWRVALFLVVLLAVFAGIAYAVVYFANNTYYVGLQGDEVTIYQGRPGGVLWLKPSVYADAGFNINEVPQERQTDIRNGKSEPTLEEAQAYITQLREQIEKQRSALGAAAGTVGAATGSTVTTTSGGSGTTAPG